MEKQSKIDLPVNNVKTEYDLDENDIVMNENTKFRNATKPDPAKPDTTKPDPAKPETTKPDTNSYALNCQICNMVFRLPCEFREHIREVHERNSVDCDICGKSFKNAGLLKAHKIVHTSARPHCCTLCPSRFKRKGGLKTHMRYMHGENNHEIKCEYCCKFFKSKELLERHLQIHQKVICEICGQRIYGRLKDHLHLHYEEPNLECIECGIKLKSQSALKFHLRKHSEVRSYKCDHCAKSFDSKSKLKLHLIIHSKERPYKCELCDKSFKRRTHLVKHLRNHTRIKDKPYKCQHCKRSFKRFGDFYNHQKIHAKEDTCSYVYTNTEVKKRLQEALQSRKKFKEDGDELVDVKEDEAEDSQLTEGNIRQTKLVTEKEGVNEVKNDLNRKNQGILDSGNISSNIRNSERQGSNGIGDYHSKKKVLEVSRFFHSDYDLGRRNVATDTGHLSKLWGSRNSILAPVVSLSSNTLLMKNIDNMTPDMEHFTQSGMMKSSRRRRSEPEDREETVDFNNYMGKEKDVESLDAKSTVFIGDHSKTDTQADWNIKADNSFNSEVDDIMNSGVIVEETDDFVIVRNENFSPVQHNDNTVAQALEADNYSSSDPDVAVNSGGLGANTEDVILVEDESLSPSREIKGFVSVKNEHLSPLENNNTPAQPIKADKALYVDLDGAVNLYTLLAKRENFASVKNERLSHSQENYCTLAQEINTDNIHSSNLDCVVNSNGLVAKTDFGRVKNQRFLPSWQNGTTVEAKAIYRSYFDGVENPDAIAAKTEDFVIVKNEIF